MATENEKFLEDEKNISIVPNVLVGNEERGKLFL